MDIVRVGKSGALVSKLVFGTALTIGTEIRDAQKACELVEAAWVSGIRAFDTSNNYGDGDSERLLGEILSQYPRSLFTLSTKGSWPLGSSAYQQGLSRQHLRSALAASLSRLGQDYVDIYYAHRWDSAVPIEEIVRTFHYFIQEGRIHYWATSQWPLHALQECYSTCDRLGLERPVAEQIGYSFLFRDAEVSGIKKFCESEGIGLLAFSPLAQGLLTGKYRTGIPPESRIGKSRRIGYYKTAEILDKKRPELEVFLDSCQKSGLVPTAVALAWLIDRGVTPVIGASTPDQIAENCESVDYEIPFGFWDSLENDLGGRQSL